MKGLVTIRLSLLSSVSFNISKEKTTEGLMVALVRMYEKPSASNKVFLMKMLFHMKMTEGGTVAEHLNEFNIVTSQLTSVGINFDDEVRPLLTLSSLLEIWDGIVMELRNSSASDTLKFDNVVSILFSEEVYRKSTRKASSSRSTLNVEIRGKTTERRQNRGRSKYMRKSKSTKLCVECWNYGKKWHLKDGWTYKKKMKEGSN